MGTEHHLTQKTAAASSPDRTGFQTWALERLARARRFCLGTPPPTGDCDDRVDINWDWVDSLCLLGLVGLVALMGTALSWKIR
jgi:hypothetical protein